MAITLSNLNRCSIFFHWKIPWQICSKVVIKNPTTSCICCHTTLWNINVRKQEIDDKLQGSVATYLRCGGVVNKSIAESVSEFFKNRWIGLFDKFTSKNVVVSCTFLQCAGQVRIVHETTTFLLVTLPNIHRFFFTGKVNNKPFLNLVINNPTTPQICSYTTLQFIVNRLFSDVCVSQSSVATCAYVGFLINDLLQIYKGIFQWKNRGSGFPKLCLWVCGLTFLAHPVFIVG